MNREPGACGWDPASPLPPRAAPHSEAVPHPPQPAGLPCPPLEASGYSLQLLLLPLH